MSRLGEDYTQILNTLKLQEGISVTYPKEVTQYEYSLQYNPRNLVASEVAKSVLNQYDFNELAIIVYSEDSLNDLSSKLEALDNESFSLIQKDSVQLGLCSRTFKNPTRNQKFDLKNLPESMNFLFIVSYEPYKLTTALVTESEEFFDYNEVHELD